MHLFKKNIKNTEELRNKKYLEEIEILYDRFVEDSKDDFQKYQKIIDTVDYYNGEMQINGIYDYLVFTDLREKTILLDALEEIGSKKHKKLLDNFFEDSKIDLKDIENTLENVYDDKLEILIEDFNSEFLKLDSLDEQIENYRNKKFEQLFKSLYKQGDLDNLNVEEFVDKYIELGLDAFLYQTDEVRNNVKLRTIIKFKRDLFYKLTEKLNSNNEFSREVIDILIKNKNIFIRGEISLTAYLIEYRKKEAIKNIKKAIKEIKDTVCAYSFKWRLDATSSVRNKLKENNN